MTCCGTWTVLGILPTLRCALAVLAERATGAGKTVMAAAVIESLFFGNDEFDVAGRRRRAVVLG